MDSVELSLKGLIKLHNGLILYKNSKIVIRQDNKRNDEYVKIISGGGSGHEPAHSSYVGYGMLSVAVCGHIFTSPSVTSILKSILLAGNQNANILLIVTNYTGDRINFGLATEIAKCKYGYKNIKTLLVDDDCSIDSISVQKSVGKRGLAGTIIINKIAGAMAQMKLNIIEIFDYCQNILLNMCTIGFTFKSNKNSLENIEIGKGIHGEPGIFSIENSLNFNLIIEKIIEKFLKKIKINTKIIILVNNLGGTSEFLLNLFNCVFLDYVKDIFNVKKIMCGTFLTSLNQEGISVTILKFKDDKEFETILKYLNYETNVPSNVFGCNKIGNILLNKSIVMEQENCDFEEFRNEQKNEINRGPVLQDFGVEFCKLALEYSCNALISNIDILNEIDKEFGDGDTGSTLNMGAIALLNAIKMEKLTYNYPKIFLQEISEIIQENVGGTSGGLYSLFFQSASKAFENQIDIMTWINALKYGNQSVMRYGLAEVNDRTMMDPLIAAEQILYKSTEVPIINILENFSKVCVETAESTKHLKPKSGRASYTFSEDSNKRGIYPDAGAFAVGIWSNAIFEAGKIVLKKFNL